MDQLDTSPPKSVQPAVRNGRHVLRPEQISLQGIPPMGGVLREIGLCIAIALGLALLATLYAHFIKGG